FHDGVQNAAVRREDAEADAALVARGQSVGEFGPGGAPVGGPEDAAAGSTAVEAPPFALTLIHRGVERVRIARIHREVDGAGVFVLIQDFVPRAAAVRGLEDAALGIRSPEMSGRRHVDDVGVAGVYDDAADVARVRQSHFLPGRAAVGGFVDAIAPRRTL